MKHLKKKLMAATAMLAISAMMLTSVSYAWFTLSTNPEISGMKATVAANENLEIALDNGYADGAAVDTASVYEGTAQGSKTGNPYTWGNLVDISSAFGTDTGKFMPVLQPVKRTDSTLQYPTYGVDGRVSGLENLLATSFVAGGIENISNSGLKGYSAATGEAPYYAFSVTFWVRSNEAGTLSLQSAAGVNRAEDENSAAYADSTVNNTAGLGSYIKIPGTTAYNDYMENMKVVFEVHRTGDTASTYVEATGMATAATSGETDRENTYYRLASPETGIVALTKNTAQKITMYVYLNGETITNADALLTDIENVEFNIQFAHSGITSGTTDGSGAMTGDDTVTKQ